VNCSQWVYKTAIVCTKGCFFFSLAAIVAGASSCRPKEPPPHTEVLFQQRSRSKIQTLDPAQIGDVPTDEVAREFLETLYYYHYLKRPYQLIPLLAAEMPDISEDGCVYTIRIRPDVFFS